MTTKFPPELEEACEDQDCTRSELIRRAVDRELARLRGGPGSARTTGHRRS